MSEDKRYPISKELFDTINAMTTRLDGFISVLNSLSKTVERGKATLWETIYEEYPELRGKMLKIDGENGEIIVVRMAENSKIEKLPED